MSVDMCKNRLCARNEIVAVPPLPTSAQGVGIAGKAQVPMRIERGRNHGGIMGPVFEKLPLLAQQAIQIRGPVGGTAGKQDHVMGTLHRSDTVKLNESQARDKV